MEYLTKYQKLSIIEEKSSTSPVNDLDAWDYYPDLRWVYNRYRLAEMQQLPCGPMPKLPNPDDYPIVIKPYVNLYGMGLNCLLINSSEEFLDKGWYHNGFWTKQLTGEHLSFDCLIKDGQLLRHFVFKGHPTSDWFGGFDYWELVNRPLPFWGNVLLNKINKHSKFSGVVNFETIGDHIIEAHLRMGDVDQLAEKKIMEEIAKLYHPTATVDVNYLKSVNPCPVYLFPIFIDEKKLDRYLNHPLTKEQISHACLGTSVWAYQRDDVTCAHPAGIIRIINLTSSTYNDGIIVRKRLLNLLYQAI